MFRPIARAAALALGLFALPAAGSAATTYSDWNAMLADLDRGSITFEDFYSPQADARTLTFGTGIVSQAIGGPAPANGVNAVWYERQYLGGIDALGLVAPLSLVWTFPTPVRAFGGVFHSAVSGAGLTLTADFDGTGAQTIHLADHLAHGRLTSGYFGVRGEAAFQTVTFGIAPGPDTYRDEYFEIDELSFSAAPPAAVPLPAALPLLMAGFAGLGLMRARRA